MQYVYCHFSILMGPNTANSWNEFNTDSTGTSTRYPYIELFECAFQPLFVWRIRQMLQSWIQQLLWQTHTFYNANFEPIFNKAYQRCEWWCMITMTVGDIYAVNNRSVEGL